MAKSAIEVLLANVSAYAKAQGLSQAALAKKARISQAGVNHFFRSLENGTVPTLRTIESLARGLKVPVAHLLDDDAPEPMPKPENPRLLARQIARLTEDFLLASEADRILILRLAERAAAGAEVRGSDAL